MITSGPSFGSRYVVPPTEGEVYDYLPEAMIGRVRNLPSFAGILAFDKWTCNADGRQAAFWKRRSERKFTASFIDQGYCFNAGEWSFPDAPLRGVFGRNDVYAGITGWESFEPWLSRIESFPESSLWPLVDQIPPEWHDSAADELEQLLSTLLARRTRVRDLILSFKNSSRNPFPNWSRLAAFCLSGWFSRPLEVGVYPTQPGPARRVCPGTPLISGRFQVRAEFEMKPQAACGDCAERQTRPDTPGVEPGSHRGRCR